MLPLSTYIHLSTYTISILFLYQIDVYTLFSKKAAIESMAYCTLPFRPSGLEACLQFQQDAPKAQVTGRVTWRAVLHGATRQMRLARRKHGESSDAKL